MAQQQTTIGLQGDALELLRRLTMEEVLRRHPTLGRDAPHELALVDAALRRYKNIDKPGSKKTRLSAVRGELGYWLGVQDIEDCMQTANKQVNREVYKPNPNSKRQLKRLQPKGGDQSRIRTRVVSSETPEIKLLTDLFGQAPDEAK